MTRGITVKGKHNEAIVYAKAIEANCENMISQYLDHPVFSGTKVRIMPDVHVGKGTVIGFTATFNSHVIPSTIGVDIGCGVCAYNLGKGKLKFDKLDEFIRKNIPSGMKVRPTFHEKYEKIVAFVSGYEKGQYFSDAAKFKTLIEELAIKEGYEPGRMLLALGTLGGGNHFIEIDKDSDNNRWLLIHSGSRNLGKCTAEYHEAIAIKETDKESPIKYLSGNMAEEYLHDMTIMQHYARINRALMAATIIEGFFKLPIEEVEHRESVHNYLDFSDNIIRKGAISAHKEEAVIIPFSMAEGAILGRGKGNEEWNNSAPHGAGRKLSRGQAKQGLSLDEFRKEMRNIWSSTVGKDTLDESPMAYKKPKDILDYIDDTVEIEDRLKPIYNFKSPE
jgi:RNA-splicing ligase RtcB